MKLGFGCPVLCGFRKGLVQTQRCSVISNCHDGHFAVWLAGGFYDDFDVLAEGGEEVHEAFDGEGAGAVAPVCG